MAYQYQYSFQRPLTPITPIHTPHASGSSGSARVRTPGQLSLHEYRKQQVTPSPPALLGQKTIKRKTGMSVLNRSEGRPSTPPEPHRLASPSPPASPEQHGPTESARPSLSQVTYYPEFHHLVSRTPPPPTSTYLSTSIFSAPLFAQDAALSGLHTTTERVDRRDALTRQEEHSHQLQPRGRGGNFKPIKRLPRPPPPDWLYPKSSRVQSQSSSDSQGPSQEALSSSSSLSLSKYEFPHPGLSHSAPPSVPSSAVETPSSKLESAAATPKILHYRGTSFDLLNPHDSLRLSDVQSPPERDNDQGGYFQALPSLEDLIQEEMANAERGGAPPRAIYDNYSSAFQSITKAASSGRLREEASAEELLPQSQTPRLQQPLSSNEGVYTPGSQKPLPKSSERRVIKETETPTRGSPLQRISRRISTLARLRTKDSAQEENQLPSISMPQISTNPPRIAPQNFGRSSPLEHGREFHRQRALTLLTVGPKRQPPETIPPEFLSSLFAESHHPSSFYEGESEYGDSVGGSNRAPSTVIGNRQSVSYGHSVGQLDYSNETTDLSSYRYEFGVPPQNTRIPPHFYEDANFTRDTTLSNIYRRYGTDYTQSPSLLGAPQQSGDISQQSAGARLFQEEDSTADFSTVADDEDRKAGGFVSGLSQFDFGLDQSRSLGDDNFTDGPSFSSPESVPAPLRIATGPPPNAPLPPVPDSRDVEPLYRRKFFAQGQSDLGSNLTSYGETRNLLHLEDGDYFTTPRNVMPQVTEQSPEESTLQTTRFLSSQSEYPFNLEAAGISPRPVAYEPEASESFLSASFDVETRRGILAATDPRVSEVSELSNYSDHEGMLLHDSSLSVPPLNVTPKSKGRESDPSTGVNASGSSKSAKHKSTFSEVIGQINDANDLAENDEINQLPTSLAPDGMYQNNPFINSARTNEMVSNRTRTHGIPAIWTRSSSPQLKLRIGMNKAGQDLEDVVVSADSGVGDDTDEWETIAGPSRPNLNTGFTLSSMASYSRLGSNMGDFAEPIHPPNSQFNVAQYRHHLAVGSDQPFLIPEYQYGPGSEFTNRNALSPPVFATTPNAPQGTTTQGNVSPLVDENELGPEPNDEIVYETTPLMSSQPTSPNEDSFNKVVEVGPEANLTGTPLGTGMRDAGSSVVQSSSPFFHSSPHQTSYKRSPLTQVTTTEEETSTSGGPILPTHRFLPPTDDAVSRNIILPMPPTTQQKGKTVVRDAAELSVSDNANVGQPLRGPTFRQVDYVPTATVTEPPKAHVRALSPTEIAFDDLPQTETSDAPPRLLPKPHQGTIRSPTRSRFAARGYRTLRKPESGDLIELQSLHSKVSIPRPLRLASRTNNTISADTLRTQASEMTRHSTLASRVNSHDTTTPLRPKRPHSYTPASSHHRRQFSGSNLQQLTLIRPEPMDVELQHDMMSKHYHRMQARYSWAIVLVVGWIPCVGVLLWSGCFDMAVSYISYGEANEIGTLQKRVALGISVAEFFVVGILIAVLVPLNLAGTI